MALEEFVKLLENSDRLQILKDGKEVFVGWLAMLVMHNEMYERMRTDAVKKFKAIPEIRHRQWKERNLMKPLEPDETPEFLFSDLQMNLYYTIYI
ncbi:hypothetical protein IMSAGC019_01067 [Lachnospiraceae bacterium]|nr:hypothetical protein IMSAGC007_02457 [Lachnospiraceae bacterium]GFI45754.1 hypothetical protein IMSAGC019_01067 [Lachnospiraceae bacterium]